MVILMSGRFGELLLRDVFPTENYGRKTATSYEDGYFWVLPGYLSVIRLAWREILFLIISPDLRPEHVAGMKSPPP